MASAPIRIFVVDDNILFAESVVAVLDAQKDFQVVGQSRSAADARPLISKNTPDLVLLELYLAGRSTLDLLRDLPTLSVRSRAIVSADAETQQDVVEAVRL